MARRARMYRTAVDAWPSRRSRAADLAGWDPIRAMSGLRRSAAEAEASGLLDVALLDAFEAEVVVAAEAAVAEHLVPVGAALGATLATSVFGDGVYWNRLDRQLAVGVSAVVHLAVEDAATVMLSELLRRVSAHEDRLVPAYPPGGAVVDGVVVGGVVAAKAAVEAPLPAKARAPLRRALPSLNDVVEATPQAVHAPADRVSADAAPAGVGVVPADADPVGGVPCDMASIDGASAGVAPSGDAPPEPSPAPRGRP